MDEQTPQSAPLERTSISSSERTSNHESTFSNSQEKTLEAHGEPDSEAPANLAKENHTGAVPNGGLRAWLHVLGCFILFFNTWGILNAFGVFQTYYESGELFNKSSSDISWIGSIQAYMVLTLGIF